MRATFVIFITDGDPTFRRTRFDVPNDQFLENKSGKDGRDISFGSDGSGYYQQYAVFGAGDTDCHHYNLEDGVTYRVSFICWPTQEAYDILANLRNGTIEYDDLTEDQKKQIVKNGDSYSVRTNRENEQYPGGGPVTTYTPATLYNGDVTAYGQRQTLEFQRVDPMPIVSEKMLVKKEWNDSVNTGHTADVVKFHLLVDGKYYQNDGSLKTKAEGGDGEGAYVIEVSKDSTPVKWQDEVKIASGTIRGSDVLELGHSYTLEEYEVTGGKDYYAFNFEFTAQTIRPMKIDGHLKYLVQVDDDNPAPQGADLHAIDGRIYYEAAGDDGTSYYEGTINEYQSAEPNVNRYNGGKKPIAKTSTLEAQGYSVTRVQSTNGTVDETEAANDTVTGTIDEANKRYYNQFTNTLGFAADAELKVTKHLDGYEWTGERYYFTLTAGDATYTDGQDPQTGTSPMPNSSKIYISSPSGTEDKTYTFGKITLKGIKIGETYTLSEKKSPAGYIITDNESTFTVTKEQGTVSITTEGANVKVAEDGITIEVENEPGATLPNSGGPGTVMMYLIGFTLAGLAGALLIIRKFNKA